MSFPLVGIERTKTAVENMIAANRIPHAILIESDYGGGKSTLAEYICRAAVCESDKKPCGECSGCRLQIEGNHPDVLYIAPEKDRKTISVNQIRDIVSDASVLPQKSAKKVFIIDPADAMTVQAQNALLKVLEEPPESVVFILTAVSRNVMLSTILSRCTVFTLNAPEKDAAADYISSVTKKEKTEAVEALNKTRGSIGGAINILKKKSAGKSNDLANSFLEAMQNGSRYDLLKILLPLEKDRAKTIDFYNALEVMIVSRARGCSSPTLSARYDRIYRTITEHKRLLKLNANISLLTSLLAIEMTER